MPQTHGFRFDSAPEVQVIVSRNLDGVGIFYDLRRQGQDDNRRRRRSGGQAFDLAVKKLHQFPDAPLFVFYPQQGFQVLVVTKRSQRSLIWKQQLNGDSRLKPMKSRLRILLMRVRCSGSSKSVAPAYLGEAPMALMLLLSMGEPHSLTHSFAPATVSRVPMNPSLISEGCSPATVLPKGAVFCQPCFTILMLKTGSELQQGFLQVLNVKDIVLLVPSFPQVKERWLIV